ncbi:hypothetical protein ACHAWF_004727 [Thalassiosira exigua]
MTSSSPAALKSCLDVLRRTDPRDAEANLAGLARLISDDDAADELYQRVDVPLRVAEDDEADGRKVSALDSVASTPEFSFPDPLKNDSTAPPPPVRPLICRQYLLCEHNRDGDSHRSPWSNAYHPPLDDGLRPPERLRSLELRANEVFDKYRELYYRKASSVSSVYLWETDDEGGTGTAEQPPGFAGCFLIRNQIDEGNYWNAIHVVDVGAASKGVCRYQLTTTILLSIAPSSPELKKTTVSGSLVRRNERERPVEDDGDHIVNVGKFVEDVEGEMRSEMEGLYVHRTKTVVELIRKEGPRETEGRAHTMALNEAVLAMAVSKKASLKDGADA